MFPNTLFVEIVQNTPPFFKIAIGLGIILFGNFGANQLALALEEIDIAASEQDVTIWGADSDDSLSNIHPPVLPPAILMTMGYRIF